MQQPIVEEVFHNGTSFTFTDVDSILFRHINATDVFIEGKIRKPDINPLLLKIADKDKVIVRHAMQSLNQEIEIEILQNADHLTSMSIPFSYRSIESCEDGEPKVWINGRLEFTEDIDPTSVFVFDGADENNRDTLDEHFGFDIRLKRQKENDCKVTLGVAFERKSQPKVLLTRYGNITDLNDIKVVIGDRVRDVNFHRRPTETR